MRNTIADKHEKKKHIYILDTIEPPRLELQSDELTSCSLRLCHIVFETGEVKDNYM